MNNSIAKNGVFNVIYNVANILFPLIIFMYVARILKPAGIGQVAYAQNIASYFVTFAPMGIPTLRIREIAKVNQAYGSYHYGIYDLSTKA